MKIISSQFLQSNINYKNCPQDNKIEIALVGRSNVGKSSLINMILNHKALAKTSSTPGKTQLINHFLINNSFYIVDLPGYGWAKNNLKNRTAWKKMVSNYLLYRKNLICVFILLDGRLPPQKIDFTFLQWLGNHQIPFSILFTKIDKQTNDKTQNTIQLWKNNLQDTWEIFPPYILTSAKNMMGRKEILAYLKTITQTITV